MLVSLVVDIHNHEGLVVAEARCRDADVVVARCPPLLDLRRVARCPVGPIIHGWRLRTRSAREHKEPLARERERLFESPHHFPLRASRRCQSSRQSESQNSLGGHSPWSQLWQAPVGWSTGLRTCSCKASSISAWALARSISS